MVIRFGEPASINKLDDCHDMGGTEIVPRARDLDLLRRRGPRFVRLVGPELLLLPALGRGHAATVDGRHARQRRSSCPAPATRASRASPVACDPRTAKTCTCTSACEVYRPGTEITSRQGSQAGADVELAQICQPQSVSLEGVDVIRQPLREHERPEREEDRGPGAGGPRRLRRPRTASPEDAPSGPAPTRRKLSKKEVEELTEHARPKYHEFLELVDLIITDDERQVFLADRRGLPEGQVHRGLLEAAVASTRRGCGRTSASVYMQRYQMALE